MSEIKGRRFDALITDDFMSGSEAALFPRQRKTLEEVIRSYERGHETIPMKDMTATIIKRQNERWELTEATHDAKAGTVTMLWRRERKLFSASDVQLVIEKELVKR